MKSFLDWAKSNLIVAILLILTILAIPAMIYFSGKWNASVRKSVEEEGQKGMRELSSISSTYEVPPVVPGAAAVTVSTPPNKATTEFVRNIRKSLTEQTEAVRGKAIESNQRGKSVLFQDEPAADRVFPAPVSKSAELRIAKAMVKRWPAEHEALLEKFHVGQPPSPESLAGELQRMRDRERNAIIEGRVEQTLTAEERETISEALQHARTQRYRDNASRFTVYGNMSMFEAVGDPSDGPLPTVETMWDWQHMLWIHSDILQAVLTANTDSRGTWTPVFQAPVKRILSIQIDPRDYVGGGSSSGALPGRDDGMGGPGGQGASAPLGQDYAAAHTGRAGWPGATNPVYDVRDVTVELIVASDRVPDLLDAIARTNFMTVTDLDLEKADAYDALRQGFDYGTDHVVKATVQIETVWIHAWTKEFMPPAVRTALGVPEDPAEPATDPSMPTE